MGWVINELLLHAGPTSRVTFTLAVGQRTDIEPGEKALPGGQLSPRTPGAFLAHQALVFRPEALHQRPAAQLSNCKGPRCHDNDGGDHKRDDGSDGH